MAAAFEQYRPIVDPSSDEAVFGMTTPEDYTFDTFEQPASSAWVTGELSRFAGRLSEIDPAASDLEANHAIVSASGAELRSRAPALTDAAREQLPITYEAASFIHDTDAIYAPDSLCSVWLELYSHQAETGDFPLVRQDRSTAKKAGTHRLVPRQITHRLPDGMPAEDLEIYLTPELYLEYRQTGLIPESGGQNGVPRIYWFERDGSGYKAGTNADQIYRTDSMQLLSMATLRGTNHSVSIELNKIPYLMAPAEQEAQRHQAELAEREANRYRTFRSTRNYRWDF